MNLRSVLVALKRRWYLATAGLLVTAGMVAAAIYLVSPTYTATSSLLLIPPKSVTGPRGNPYLNLGGLNAAVDVLKTRVMTGALAEELTTAEPDAEISVESDFASSAPVVVVSASAGGGSLALSMRDALAAEVIPTLAAMQGDLGVPPASRITAVELASDTKPELSRRNQLRAVIVAGGAGFAATLLGTALLDGILIRRRLRVQAAAAQSEPAAGQGGADTFSGLSSAVVSPSQQREPPDRGIEDTSPIDACEDGGAQGEATTDDTNDDLADDHGQASRDDEGASETAARRALDPSTTK